MRCPLPAERDLEEARRSSRLECSKTRCDCASRDVFCEAPVN